MAVLDFNADEKFRAYHVLACLNRSFRNIFNNLGELKETGVLNKKQLNTLRGISQELQADVNFHALETLQETEEGDWGRFGKARLKREGSRKKATGNRQQATAEVNQYLEARTAVRALLCFYRTKWRRMRGEVEGMQPSALGF